MRQNQYEITGQGQVDVAEIPLISEQEPGGFLLTECPINEIERFDVVQGYAAEWRKAFSLIPQDLGPSENLALAKKFSPTAKQHEAAITATLAEIKARRIEIMRPAPDKLAVAETLDRAEKVLDGLLAEIKAARKDTEDRVKDEMERRKLDAVNSSLLRIGAATTELFLGPLLSVPLHNPAERLRNAGKGKKTPETCIAAIHAEADLIIAERTALAALCVTNLDLINAADLPAVSAETDRLLPRPTAEVQAVIAQRQAEAAAVQAKKQAAVQHNPDRLDVNKADIERINNLFHLDNWRRKHKARVEAELPHPDDQADLWQFFGAHYARVESRNKPPHPADAHQAAPQETSAKGDCKTCWHNEFNRGCKEPSCRYEKKPLLCADAIDAPPYPTPAESKAMYEATQRTEAAEREAAAAAAQPAQPAPPAAPQATERPEGMPETGSAFRLELYCGDMSKPEMQALLDKIFDLAEEHGAQVVSAKTI